MKKAVLSLALLVFLLLPTAALADSANTNSTNTNTVGQGQEQVVVVDGGQQYMIFDGGKPIRQFTGVYPEAYMPNAATLPYEQYRWGAMEKSVKIFPHELLYGKEEALTKAGGIKKIKETGRFFLPPNTDPVVLLNEAPGRLGDFEIYTAELDAPNGGMSEETLMILLSYGKHRSGGRRAYAELMPLNNPKASGLAIPAGASQAFVNGSQASALAVTPVLGWSRTVVEMPYRVKVTYYNDGYVPVPPEVFGRRTIKSLMPRELGSIYFDFDKYYLRPDQEGTVAIWKRVIYSHWSDVPFFMIMGECDERGSLEYNDTLGAKRAITVRDRVIDDMAADGFNRAELKDRILSPSEGKRNLRFTEHQKNRTVMLYFARKAFAEKEVSK
ncbi:MAG: hypothetical protein V1867_08415 [Candidatus Falkowbacteria bacterium]